MSVCILGTSKKRTFKCVILNTLSVCVFVKANARCVCGGQSTACENWISPST